MCSFCKHEHMLYQTHLFSWHLPNLTTCSGWQQLTGYCHDHLLLLLLFNKIKLGNVITVTAQSVQTVQQQQVMLSACCSPPFFSRHVQLNIICLPTLLLSPAFSCLSGYLLPAQTVWEAHCACVAICFRIEPLAVAPLLRV